MPRYFFNVYDGSVAFDDEGVDLIDPRELNLYMLAMATELFREPKHQRSTWQMEVLDERGKIVRAMILKATLAD